MCTSVCHNARRASRCVYTCACRCVCILHAHACLWAYECMCACECMGEHACVCVREHAETPGTDTGCVTTSPCSRLQPPPGWCHRPSLTHGPAVAPGDQAATLSQPREHSSPVAATQEACDGTRRPTWPDLPGPAEPQGAPGSRGKLGAGGWWAAGHRADSRFCPC